ncbi:hypothetical protein, partial [Streptococcus pneumoniae]
KRNHPGSKLRQGFWMVFRLGVNNWGRMMFMGLLSVILFVLVVAIFKNVVEGRDVKFELTVELVLIVIYVILYQIVFN